MTPRATYRLQFNKDFGFDQAAALAPYLAQLGVSHLYASPYLKARPGSTHGYDIVDHNALNPELGDQAAFDRMTLALKENGLKQVLDFVPNHMGVGGSDNPLWLDVLEWGPDATHAGWFDIDWDTDHRYLHNKLLVPSLGDQYGAVLESGQLVLRFDEAEGSFAVWAYGQHKLPICPLHYARVLGDGHPELERLGDAFSALPEWRPQVGRRAADLKAEIKLLASERPEVLAAVNAAVARLNGQEGDLASWEKLNALIADQNWRVAHFRVAADDINYRRFFNVNDLAGLRMELPDVFDHAHRLVLHLLKQGTLDGLRIDHIDGLLDPKAYLEQLRAAGGPEFYLVVEKILAHHESLREDWPVQGTTGYDVTNFLLGFLIDPAGEKPFSGIYARFTGLDTPFAQVVRDSKLRIMDNEMASELNVLARDAAQIARQNPRTADFTHNILHRAIRALVAGFAVYRTYVDTHDQPTEADASDLDKALSQARRMETDVDASVFDFLARLLSGELVAKSRSGFSRSAVLRCAMKLQQYSGPVMAKGLEDTAFYRYNRFVALNEVGGHPDAFGVSSQTFHDANRQRAKRWPASMLTTSTHDTKRGEDTRARLAVLSELPEEWERQVQAWSRLLRPQDVDTDSAVPTRNDEYLFYQLLVGSWPVELLGSDSPDPAGLEAYATRLKGALTKSMREAKEHSGWAAPDVTYESAMLALADTALSSKHSADFLAAFRPFAEKVAALGAQNSLLQTVLKLTIPGVPDIYQGCELWDFSLVDPDNRRPVDFTARQAALIAIETALQQPDRPVLPNLLAAWQDGHFKMAITRILLKLRQQKPALFAEGSYEAVQIDGADSDAVCAFTRSTAEDVMLVAVRRFPGGHDGRTKPLDATLRLPAALRGSGWRNIFAGHALRPAASELTAADLFQDLPAAVLVKGPL